MAASTGSVSAASRAVGEDSLLFDTLVLCAALCFVGGLLVDGWAHNHLDLSKEGFFTPYHLLFYSGFAALATVVVAGTARRRDSGTSFLAAVPQGYGSTLAGLAIFGVGGLLDMLWHIRFGVEQDIEALFSPTHLLLATGIGAILSGPIRSAVARNPARSWRLQLPGLVSLALFGTLVLFFFMWAFSTGAGRGSDPHVAFPTIRGAALEQFVDYQIGHGMTAIVVRSLLIAGIVLWAARNFALPFGAVTLLVVLPNVLVGAMLVPAPQFLVLQAVSAVAAGLFGDFALGRYAALERRPWGARTIAFALPCIFWTVYLALGALLNGGYWWSPHVVYGAPAIAGLVGLLLALAGEARPTPASSR